ncbi:MAG: hypothetical protein ASARMPRED_001705 [Alectoria sarmentosa]|nr:MAG: hypothetical protein ASARMPRED_001705 [Alectoria sarmentosa]
MPNLDLLITWPLTTVAASYVLYVILLYTYRLTLHPLAKCPGPRLAAVTFWLEFYHDFFHRGQYIFGIRDMHAKFGHIVRISPDELHINDPSFLPELMPAGWRRRDKYPRMLQVFGFSQAAGATADHDLHRTWRSAISKMFSKESQLLDNIDRVAKFHYQGKDSKTVFDELFDSRLSEEDKRPLRLLQEAQTFSIAGTETKSWTLSIMTVLILSTPRVLAKLRNELKVAIPDVSAPLSIKDIEQLPYLNAVITEGLRLALGNSRRQTRISPTEVMTFNDGKKQWHIPPRTPVGMATPLVHLNPDVFADPMDFRPERFIENPQLKQYVFTFSRGSRQCLGMHLAYTEPFLVHSEIWRRFGSKEDHGEDGWLELFETDRSDIDMVADRFVPSPRADSKGIRIKVRK